MCRGADPNVWRSIIVGDDKSWVLFRHGTCVVLPEAPGDPSRQALAVLQRYRPVHPGTPSGDFEAVRLTDHPGWVVTYEHPDVLNYIHPDEVADISPPTDGGLSEADAQGFIVGLLGRSLRERDSDNPQNIHVQEPTC